MKRFSLFIFSVIFSFVCLGQAVEGTRGAFRDSVTSLTNNTSIVLKGLGTGKVNIEGAYDLPDTDGSVGQVMQTNGAGTVSFVSASSIISFGTDNQVPFVNSGGTDYDYSSNFTFDGSILSVLGTGNVTGQWNVDNLRIDGNTHSSTSGAINITPLAGQHLNITTSGAGDFVVNTNQLYVDASTARVGVGIASPDGPLHVHTATAGTFTPSSNADDLVVENSATGGMTITTPDASTAQIFFGSPSDVNHGVISSSWNSKLMTVGTSGTNMQLAFTIGVATEAVRIDASGNVGIGTTLPEVLLEVQGVEATNASVLLDADDGDDNADSWFIQSTASDNDLDIINHTSTRFSISSAGAVTIPGEAGTGTRVKTVTSAGVQGTLANGSDGQVLTLVSGAPAWSDNALAAQVSEVTISAANFANINSTPVTIISAPGVDMYINIVDWTFSMNYATTQWTDGGNLIAEYASGTDIVAINSASSYTIAGDWFTSPTTNNSSFSGTAINQAVQITTATSDPTTGDSDIKVKIWYTIESL